MIPNLNVVRQQSSTADKIKIQLLDTAGAPVSGVTPTLTLDKTQSGTYSGVSGACSSSDAKGVCWWTGNATDRNTLGPCVVYVTGTGAVSYTFTLTITLGDPAKVLDANNRVDTGKIVGNVPAFDLTSGLLSVSLHDVLGQAPDVFVAAAAALGIAGDLSTIEDGILSIQTDLGNVATSVSSTGTNVTTLLGRLTLARAGYLDNLNVGGAVASHADVAAINQSASKHLTIQTVGQYERPESGSVTYTIEVNTFNAATGALVNADSAPTLTATGNTTGSLTANLTGPTNGATGVYTWTYTVASNATLEQVRFSVSATINASVFPLACYTQVADLVGATWTTTDRGMLTAAYNKLPSKTYLAGTNNSDGDVQLDEATGTVARVALVDTATAVTNPVTLTGDLTSTMKTSVTTAATAATPVAASINGVTFPTGFSGLTVAAIQSGLATASSLSTAQGTLTKFETMIETPGAGVYRYTTLALVNGPAGTGGGGDVTITPLFAQTNNPRNATRDLPPIAQGSEPTDRWTITDAAGAAVNLSGKTVRFVALEITDAGADAESVYDDTLAGLYKYETSGSGIVVSGTGHNIVDVTHSAANTATTGKFLYELWNVTDKLLLASGKLPIKPAVFDV